jgi:hypothetical protein
MMTIGPDLLVFISATRALLHALKYQPLNDEERNELEGCLRELNALLSQDRKRHAAWPDTIATVHLALGPNQIGG